MAAELTVRPACLEDAKQIGQLIYDTIRTINRKDYSEQQLEAWAPDPYIFSTYEESYAYVVELEGKILGFGNLTSTGYLHRFYVHKDFQKLGIGTLLLKTIETKAHELDFKEISTEASITAKPFFLSKGWQIQERQTKIFRNTSFINYKMYKKFS